MIRVVLILLLFIACSSGTKHKENKNKNVYYSWEIDKFMKDKRSLKVLRGNKNYCSYDLHIHIGDSIYYYDVSQNTIYLLK